MGSLLSKLAAAGNAMERSQQQQDKHAIIQSQVQQMAASQQNQRDKLGLQQQKLAQSYSTGSSGSKGSDVGASYLNSLLGIGPDADPMGGQQNQYVGDPGYGQTNNFIPTPVDVPMPGGATMGIGANEISQHLSPGAPGQMPQGFPSGGQGSAPPTPGQMPEGFPSGGQGGVPPTPGQMPEGFPSGGQGGVPPASENTALIQRMQPPPQPPQIPVGSAQFGGSEREQQLAGIKQWYGSLGPQEQEAFAASPMGKQLATNILRQRGMGGGSMNHMDVARTKAAVALVTQGMYPDVGSAYEALSQLGGGQGVQALNGSGDLGVQATRGSGTEPGAVSKATSMSRIEVEKARAGVKKQTELETTWAGILPVLDKLDSNLNMAEKLVKSGDFRTGITSELRGAGARFLAEQGIGGEAMAKAGKAAELVNKVAADVVLNTSYMDSMPGNRATNQLREFIQNGKFGSQYLPETNMAIINAQRAGVNMTKIYRQFLGEYARNSPTKTWDDRAGTAYEATLEQYPLFDYETNEYNAKNVKKVREVLSNFAKVGARGGELSANDAGIPIDATRDELPVAPVSTAAPPAAERSPGATYDTPQGPLLWTGTGWVRP